MTQADSTTFFVSYNHLDEAGATWIAWQLEQAGHKAVIQAWDFAPGSNFILEMQRAASEADKTILVLSPNYLGSHFAQPEWAATFAQDPEGLQRRLIPVRVAPCDVTGLLGQIVYIDLVGTTDQEAAAKLMAGINPSRAKPLTPPPFPGPSAASSGPPVRQASAQHSELQWEPVHNVSSVVWRTSLDQNFYGRPSGPACLEVQLVPINGRRIEVRRLAGLSEQLADLGRQHGLFSQTQELSAQATGELAYAKTVISRDTTDTGLLVTREGQRGAWIPLPRDSLGSVLDVADAGPRLAAVLQLLVRVEVPLPERFAVAAKLGPTMMLTVGNSDVIGRRTSASMSGFGSDDDIALQPEDSVDAASVLRFADEIAEELLARLVAKLRRR